MKRPFSVTLLALGVLLFALYNVGRVAAALYALTRLDFVTNIQLQAPVIVIMIIGLDWAIGFTVAAIGLWRLKAWARHWMIIALITYELQIWIERLTLEQSPYERLTRPLDAAITLIVFASTINFFFLQRIRTAFKALPPEPTEQP